MVFRRVLFKNAGSEKDVLRARFCLTFTMQMSWWLSGLRGGRLRNMVGWMKGLHGWHRLMEVCFGLVLLEGVDANLALC